MILSSEAKCPHCATWQRDARAFSIGLVVLLVLCGMGAAAFGFKTLVQLEQKAAAEHEMRLLERSLRQNPR